MAIQIVPVLPGDTFELDVPPRRMIPYGHYTATVESQAPPTKYEPVRYRVIIRDPRFKSSRVVLVVPQSPALNGYGFLGRDQHPVCIKHVPNLEARLKLSLNNFSR